MSGSNAIWDMLSGAGTQAANNEVEASTPPTVQRLIM